NRLANYLLAGGAGRGTMVGLFTDDPLQVITGILGVLKAGGVFVPLDPTFPDGRLRAMASQVSPQWFVVETKYVEKLRRVWADAASPARVIFVGAERAADAQLDRAELKGAGLEVVEDFDDYANAQHPGLESDPDAPCSVYFTSGSTGRPKAILGRLKGIDHFMRWEIEAVGAGLGTRVSQLALPSFDGFLKDVFVPLCSGGTVCAPESRDLILDAWSLADWLDVEQIEVLHCVPSVFRALTNEKLNDKYFEAMRCVVMTGEPLYPSDVKRWMDTFGERVRLWNIYGTTETSMSKFAHEVTPEDTERPSIPVGRPIKGSAVMVINSRGQLCREEAVGEVHIRTPYRSHGYYNEPELTKEVFIQNPFSDDPSDIVHKTGDFGRLLKNGELELLGRRDQQVKVRGVRVELGEIENLLRGHEDVADVAVVDRDDAEGNKFLVAYLTMSNGTRAEDLRGYLSERLPEAMMPSAFVQLEQLPRTLNGKIDRKALPALELLQAEREMSSDLVPRNPVEEIVAGIWREVLRLPAVGRSGNFFNLGGHSLLVTQVLARVRECLEVELPVRSLFEAPTIEQFSQLIQEQISDGKLSDLSEITRAPRDGELPLSFAQQRMWFFEQIAGGTGAFNIALGVRLRGALNVAALEQTFGEIVRRHESLRTIFPAVDDRPLQVIQPPSRFHLPLVNLAGLSHEEREREAARLAREETLRRFDLARGPLIRPTLVRLGDEEHIVVCTMHHIVGDGQSFEVIISEMSRIYGVFAEGQPSPLPELQVQYADYAAWQRQWLQGEALETRLAYWRRQLAGAPRRLSLPHQRTRPKVQRFTGAKHFIRTTPEQTEALRELSRREGTTLYMTMLAAFVVLLNRYTGDEDIVVGSTYANRERAEAERIIGILTNTLILRVDASGAATFRDVMRRVREVCLDAYSYQVPPELLREDLGRRGEDRDRLFDVWFQLEKERAEKFDMRGLEVEPYDEGKEVTRAELSISLGERTEEIVGVLEYDDQLFTAETTSHMLGDYFHLLSLMVEDPERILSTISLTRKEKVQQLSSSFVANLEV
ncbi:MAG TPA: amino acid adenylation domain-containing protein, partial [Pyrinomonadaceae bacterium]